MVLVLIERVRGDASTREEIDATLLRRMDGLVDNDQETTTIVEYCLLNCPGSAHQTGIPDSPSHFCNRHVHRSVAVQLKQGLEGLGDLGSIL